MKVVLYTEDMEPITVIELTEMARQYLDKYGRVRLAVYLPPMLSYISIQQNPAYATNIKTVDIYAEKLIRKGISSMMLFTGDEENALLLKSVFLPGQQSALNEHYREAFSKGFLEAVQLIGK